MLVLDDPFVLESVVDAEVGLLLVGVVVVAVSIGLDGVVLGSTLGEEFDFRTVDFTPVFQVA